MNNFAQIGQKSESTDTFTSSFVFLTYCYVYNKNVKLNPKTEIFFMKSDEMGSSLDLGIVKHIISYHRGRESFANDFHYKLL